MYVLISENAILKYPYSISELRAENPNVSFPSAPSATELAGWNVYRVHPTPVPDVTDSQTAEESEPEWDGDKWVQTWSVRGLTSQELSDRLEARRSRMRVPRLAARLALIDVSLWDSIPALIDGITDATEKAKTLAFFEDAQNWRRDDATVQALAAGLGLSDTQLDDLFDAAAVIEAGL